MPRGGAVYVVDDESAERRAIGSMVAAAGFALHPYVNGGSFLDDTPFLKPGCVLLDMPTIERGGPEMLTAISERATHFPILAMAQRGRPDCGPRDETRRSRFSRKAAANFRDG